MSPCGYPIRAMTSSFIWIVASYAAIARRVAAILGPATPPGFGHFYKLKAPDTTGSAEEKVDVFAIPVSFTATVHGATYLENPTPNVPAHQRSNIFW